jgi:hypothetical protein
LATPIIKPFLPCISGFGDIIYKPSLFLLLKNHMLHEIIVFNKAGRKVFKALIISN